MAGIWETQDKILPGVYLNFKTNTPLTITWGERGTAVLLQEISGGTMGDIYEVTELEENYPEGVVESDRLLAREALKGAQTVLVYNLGTEHDAAALSFALEALKTVDFNTLAYPYGNLPNSETITEWVEEMRNEEGKKIQAVLANHNADSEAVINVVQGIELLDDTTLTAEEVTAWVAGITAGSKITQSNTGRVYAGAIDVVPRMTRTEMEDAITAGKFIFKVDTAQNVTAVYDIDSLVTVSEDKGKQFKSNRVVRTLDGINKDINNIYESNFMGKVNRNIDGKSLFRTALIEYFNELQRMGAIQNFTPEDVEVLDGIDLDAVVVNCNIQLVYSMEKSYITINLS